MTWLGQWFQKIQGLWNGPVTPTLPGTMAARITGTSSVTAGLIVTGQQGSTYIDLAATITGASSVYAALELNQIVLPVYVGAVCHPRFIKSRPRSKVYKDMAAVVTGKGSLSAKLVSTVNLSANLTGTSNVKANLFVLINASLIRKKRDEEAVVAWLMAA